MDIILLPAASAHVEWRQPEACVESEKRFEFTISHCCEGSLMGRILSPSIHVEWRQACVESEKIFEFKLTISRCREGL